MKRQHVRWCVLLAAMVLMFQLAVPAEAATKLFDVTSGIWTNATDWYADGVPGSADSVYIGSSNPGGVTPATCTLDAAGQQCDRFYVGHQAGNIGQFDFTGGDLTVIGAGTAPQVCIGYIGTGTVNQTAGTWNNGGKTLGIGQDVGSYGEYNLSNGAITNVYFAYVGNNGHGVLNLGANAEFRQSNRTYIGYLAGSVGVVNQTGGLLDMGGTSAAYLTVGQGGYGEYNISGGVLTNCYKLYNGNGGTGVLSIAGSSASIRVFEFRNYTAKSTLRIAPDSGGISPVNAVAGAGLTGKIYLAGTLEVDFSNCNSTNDLPIINHAASRSGTFAAVKMTAGWSAEVQYDTFQVRLINIKAPPKGTLITVF